MSEQVPTLVATIKGTETYHTGLHKRVIEALRDTDGPITREKLCRMLEGRTPASVNLAVWSLIQEGVMEDAGKMGRYKTIKLTEGIALREALKAPTNKTIRDVITKGNILRQRWI